MFSITTSSSKNTFYFHPFESRERVFIHNRGKFQTNSQQNSKQKRTFFNLKEITYPKDAYPVLRINKGMTDATSHKFSTHSLTRAVTSESNWIMAVFLHM
ncbi:hypothetical protein TNCT_31321 [Trichonephila clavata]|uniref:Uncharacterized protein n=1 Tax=Trichonephila clavata TaxID=2740835 RepID=A0A8X6HUZ7_TRICU|nr:hypothetical protein TNCT_31321 [Trichonephila clavata]